MTALISKILLSYLLGSVSGSLLVGRLRRVDIRQQGSGNAGGTNAFRTQGLAFALAVVLIDIGKGVLASGWIASIDVFGSTPLAPSVSAMACGFAAILGHCYPLWHRFHGGKGAATGVGVLIVVAPCLLLPVAVTWLAALILTGYVSLATLLASFSLVPGAWWLHDRALLVFSVSVALFLLFTHRGNIVKLRAGTEYRFEGARRFLRKR